MENEPGAHPRGVGGGGCRRAATLQIEIKKNTDFKGLSVLPFRREQPLKSADD